MKCHNHRVENAHLYRDEKEKCIGEFDDAHIKNHFILNFLTFMFFFFFVENFMIFWMLYCG